MDKLNPPNFCLEIKVVFSKKKQVKTENSEPLVEMKQSTMYKLKTNWVKN